MNIINRRRVYGGKKLPYDYEVLHLTSNQGAFIKLPYYANDNTVLETIFYKISNCAYALGTRTSASAGGYFAIGINSDGSVKLVVGSHNNLISAPSSMADIIIEAGGGELTVNGSTTTYTNPTFASTNPFDIFCAANNAQGSAIGGYYAPFPIGNTKIRENGVILYNLIPVVDFNGVGCLYDKVPGQLFYNQGTGYFIVGPRVNS